MWHLDIKTIARSFVSHVLLKYVYLTLFIFFSSFSICSFLFSRLCTAELEFLKMMFELFLENVASSLGETSMANKALQLRT